MPLHIIRQDITRIKVDAIVNAANNTLLGGGGVDGAIHRAAGSGLLEECRTLGGCDTGDAKITGAYNLPCKFVIHTVGPVYRGGNQGEKELLESCYRKSLALAKANKCEGVAFPLISSGIFGYPKGEALRVATDVISGFLLENDMTVYLTIFDKSSFEIGEKLFADIKSFIDDNYVDVQAEMYPERRREMPPMMRSMSVPYFASMYECEQKTKKSPKTEDDDVVFAVGMGADQDFDLSSLEELMGQLDESFSQMLLRKIDEKGMKDSECYKKANIDRKLFSKIRSNVNYKPGKTTVIAFAVALELSLDETKDMLMKAGFALSHSNKFDLIIEYFISKGNYNIFEINEALFAFDQCLLGA